MFKNAPNTGFCAHIYTCAIRPTIDARKELYTAAKKKAEEIKVQVRKHHAASLKRGKYEKHSIELEEVRRFCPYSPPQCRYPDHTTVPEADGQVCP